MKHFIPNEAAMLKFGQKLSKEFLKGSTILLKGNLGTGKTTLVKGILQGLGHKGSVKSPTYTLVEPYHLQGMDVYHFDLYRLGDPEELEYIGGRDYFHDNALCLIEWPDKAAGYLPQETMVITLHYQKEGREINMEYK